MALDKFRRIDMQINRANDYQLETQFAKEGDYNGRELVVQITNGGEVSNQSGVSLNLGWHHNSVGNSGLDPFTVVDASQGIFKITYPTEMLNAGDVTATIQVLEGGKITLTRNFNITVEYSPINEDAIVSENSFTVLQQALETVNQYDSRIKALEDNSGNNVAVGELEEQLLQSDYAERVASLVGGYEKMYYKRENSIGWVSVMLLNKDEHITWTFRNNTYDDFYILGDCFSGDVKRDLAIYQNKNYETTTGTWITSAQNTHYTTEVGATMTTYFDGEKIEFHHYADNRGGIWEFVLDDDTTNKVTVSTWSETAIATNNKVLFEGLEFGNHKLVGTFKGDDPAHVPSSGAGTSRGWVYVNGLNGYLTYRSFKTQLINGRVQDIMVGFSNKEFAFSLKKSGSTQTYQFVPMHNSIGTAFEKEPVKFVADSTILSETNMSELTVGEFYECTKFSAIQSVYGRNPSNNSENLVEINTNVTISKDGNVEITGKLKPLTNVDVENGYAIMLPISKSATTKVVTSKNNEYSTTSTDGSRTNLTAEGDTTKSLVSVSSENKDYISSLRFNDIKNTLRTGVEKGDVDMWIEHRDANMQKLYFRQFSNTTLTPSDIFKFSATINCAKVIDVYNLI